MGRNNFNIYYGIVFCFLYIQVYRIISSLFISPMLALHWNIYIILTCLILLIVAFSVWFYTIKQFPSVKIWITLLVVAALILLEIFGLPEVYYLRGGGSYYAIKEQLLISNSIALCRTINTIILIVISFIRYVKGNK